MGFGEGAGLYGLPRTPAVYRALILSHGGWSSSAGALPTTARLQPRPCLSKHAGVGEVSVSLATCSRTLLFSYSFSPFLWELVHLST